MICDLWKILYSEQCNVWLRLKSGKNFWVWRLNLMQWPSSSQAVKFYCNQFHFIKYSLEFNLSYKFAEYLSPVIINAQQKLLRQLELSGNQTQPHFERLKAELGKYPRIEDLFFLNFKSEIDLDRLKKLDAEIKLDSKSSKYLSESFLKIFFRFVLNQNYFDNSIQIICSLNTI